MTRKTGTAVLLGKGELNWQRSERISDRYGAVTLYKAGDPTDRVALNRLARLPGFKAEMAGTQGQLMVEVIEGRKSDHIGDLFHGFCQKRIPTTGERFVLGSGILFVEKDGGVRCIGVRPKDGRDNFWLDPEILYTVHTCIVKLLWEQD